MVVLSDGKVTEERGVFKKDKQVDTFRTGMSFGLMWAARVIFYDMPLTQIHDVCRCLFELQQRIAILLHGEKRNRTQPQARKVHLQYSIVLSPASSLFLVLF
jgi:hypothetical protein